jgi:6-phosphogluconolactonase (cycloisomerase 2 family)
VSSARSEPRRFPTIRPRRAGWRSATNGRYLFTVNTGSGTISSYSIRLDGGLVLDGTVAIQGSGADIDARLTPDGRYLLVDGSGGKFVSVFAVDGGNLTELASCPSPLPASATASAGIVNT